jgi:hypothetical protein
MNDLSMCRDKRAWSLNGMRTILIGQALGIDGQPNTIERSTFEICLCGGSRWVDCQNMGYRMEFWCLQSKFGSTVAERTARNFGSFDSRFTRQTIQEGVKYT